MCIWHDVGAYPVRNSFFNTPSGLTDTHELHRCHWRLSWTMLLMRINSSHAKLITQAACFWFHDKPRFENRAQLMCFVSDRGFRQYRQCVRPIKHTCPLGTDVMYGYDSRLRTYLLKLDFICRVHKTGMYPMCTHAGIVHRHAHIATLQYKHRYIQFNSIQFNCFIPDSTV